MKKIFIIILCTVSIQFVNSQTFDGFALYNPSGQGSNTVYLIDEAENIAHTWDMSTQCNYALQLKKNGNLIRGAKYSNNILGGAAEGGMVQEIAPDGSIVWEYVYSSADHLSHHDLTLVGDNVLLTAWEVKTAAEVIAIGGDVGNSNDDSWPTHFIELEPDGNGGANIVWEWHIWDHLCQSFDASKPNYVANIADHPELIDINMLPNHIGDEDWFHVNGVDYNEELDQIVFSSRFSSEIYIIDHSTTTAEAASSSGGNSGMGGDILYRWGNPQNYGMGGPLDRIIPGAVHDARWIKNDGRPNGGFLQIFNNCGGIGGCTGGPGQGPPTANSSIDGIETPWDSQSNTYIRTPGQAFSPASYTTRYECEYDAGGQSASDRMSNGNIFVNASGGQGGAGVMYEVDADTEQIIWGPYQAGSQKGFRYECDYPGIIALEPYMYSNGNITTTCFSATSIYEGSNDIIVFPNPTSNSVNIELKSSQSSAIEVKVYNPLGQEIFSDDIVSYSGEFKQKINLKDYAEGVYIINITTDSGDLYTNRISYTR